MANHRLRRFACATDDHEQHLLNTNSDYRAARQAVVSLNKVAATAANIFTGTIRIPVVFHIVYATDEQNISVAQIDSQIDNLERDFNVRNLDDLRRRVPAVWADRVANPNIQFFRTNRDPKGRVTSGIVRKQMVGITEFAESVPGREFVKSSARGGSDPWDPTRFLNVWVCPIAGLLGFAQFPTAGPAARATDGVVINYEAFGSIGTAADPYDMGRTLVHEIGHYLGLFHIWGDRSDCMGDDRIADTPPQRTSNRGKPLFPHVTCTNGPNGDMFMNYMDYTDDDVTIMFTKAQVDVMRGTLNTVRKSLWSSGFQSVLKVQPTQFPTDPTGVKFNIGKTLNGGKLDLTGIKMPSRPGDDLELHSAKAADGYEETSRKAVKVDPDLAAGLTYASLMHYPSEVTSEGRPDLFIVNTKGVVTDSVEVQIYSGASGYLQTIRNDVSTLLPVTNGEDWTFVAADYNGDGYPDLLAIKKAGTTNKKVEVHVLSGKDDYKTWLAHCYTALDEVAAGSTVDFLAADWNGDGSLDLVAIQKSNSCHAATHIEVLSGASKYQEVLLQSETTFLKTSEDVDFALADWTGDGRPDLIAIKKSNTDSGKTEIQVIAG